MKAPTDQGETLLEVLISVMIMGVAIVVLLGGLGTSIRMSDIHRKQAAAGALVRAFAESIEAAVAASPTAYRDCADKATYTPIFTTGDSNYEREVLVVRYWNDSVFSATCAPDLGVQQVSLRVSSADHLAVEDLDVIIRKPCRPLADFPADTACT
jgi:Tfp pilus assembly protein PilV